ncbi:PREDICTED: double-strand break repair protein MRE11A [Dufourea novaeangliae]|uniref:double-strand break repair protein MRE11A n=1 Tax=Dufourea novaeangliae TaxID=178035 RepID=UPI0007674442|nr:PREDICTED: double-strand break repair protein MRE11A [Dufourea novaeangliae]
MSAEQGSNGNLNPDDTFKILIATDIHLGFSYNKRRGQELDDSFVTFEEILQYGKEHEVDFILLGGDLFHETKPSQIAVIKCMELLRKYCLGSREIKVQFLSDPEVVFKHCTYKNVNYEDPNFNVSMPIFSIHGNHDDPSFGAVGSMDLLSVSGLVNYFGKWTDLTQVTIPPLVMKKGETHVALYGLSYINDQRLSRLIRDYKVDMLRPKEIPNCFNIFVLHQNRVQRKQYAYVPQHKLPNFLDLIIWGHEHECRITPEFISEGEYFISQPGSSIATSLCSGEAKLKHIGLLSINGMKFKMKKLRLQTVRPFAFDNLVLKDEDIPKNYTQPLSESVYNFVDNHIENVLIPNAAKQLSGHPMQPIQPLIRLRIFYSEEDEMFDVIKMAQKYCEEVANPMDMIIFRKATSYDKKSRSSLDNINDDLEDIARALCYNDEEADWNTTVQGEVKKHFTSEQNKDKLTVLTVNGLNEALNRFIDRGDNDAFENLVCHQMKKTVTYLETCDIDADGDITAQIKSFRDKRTAKAQEEEGEIRQFFNSENRTTRTAICDLFKDIESHNSSEDKTNKVPATRGKGRGTGTGTRDKGSPGGRGSAKTSNKDSLHVTTTRPSRVTKPTKKQDQTTLQTVMVTSLSQHKQSSTKVTFINDSDSD